MGKADTALSIWYKNKKRFADLFNGAIFHGQQLIKPEELELIDSKSEELLADKKDKLEKIQRYRDVIMRWNGKFDFVLLTCENQEKVHYAMPVRALIYDGLSYLEQIRELRNCNENKMISSDEFLTGMRKEDKLCPIIPLVVYYGEKEWDGSLDIHGMLKNFENNSEDDVLKKYIPNYRINLLDIGRLESVDSFKTDLQKVFQMLQYKENIKDLFEYVHKEEDYFKKVDIETYNVIRVLLGSQKKLKEVKARRNQEVQVDMCKALQDLYDNGVEEGVKLGQIKGFIEALKEIGQPENDTLNKLVEKFSVDLEIAEKYMKEYWK